MNFGDKLEDLSVQFAGSDPIQIMAGIWTFYSNPAAKSCNYQWSIKSDGDDNADASGSNGEASDSEPVQESRQSDSPGA